jgi:hypothetical protein
MPELKIVTVPVVKEFTHEGRTFQPGDTISCAPVFALAWERKGYVSLQPNYQTRALTPEPVAVRRRGRPRKDYQRADMRAEE